MSNELWAAGYIKHQPTDLSIQTEFDKYGEI